MFISKHEKQVFRSAILLLQEQVRDLTAKVIMMGNFPEARKTRKGRNWTPEQRAIASERMKKQQAEQKAKRGQA